MKHFRRAKSSRRLDKRAGLLLGIFLLACSQTATSPETAPPAGTSSSNADSKKEAAPKNAPQTPAATEPARTLPPEEPCGEHICYRFKTSQEVLFPLILHHQARVIAFGEAHAPASFQGRSTVKRFTDDLLPSLAAGSSHVLVELLRPPIDGCEKEKKVAKEESKKITQGQAKNNQNEYLALGHAAHSLGVVPDILHATCQDLKLIASPEGGVVAMMETIARLSETSLKAQRRNTKKGRPLVLAYGGALHNDAVPREGRESWSYGPALVKASKGAYLEIDLIVPELIGTSESWKSFAWYSAYEELDHQEGLVLMRWGERSYSLFFAPGDPGSDKSLQKTQAE